MTAGLKANTCRSGGRIQLFRQGLMLYHHNPQLARLDRAIRPLMETSAWKHAHGTAPRVSGAVFGVI